MNLRSWRWVGVLAVAVMAAESIAVLAQAQPTLWHPWPVARHDAQRTGRALVMGPQRASLRAEMSMGDSWFTSSPVIGAGGRAYATVTRCVISNPFIGCLLYASWLTAITPSGIVRPFPNPLTAVRYQGQPAIGRDGAILAPSAHGLTALTPRGTVKWVAPGVSGNPTVTADGSIYVVSGHVVVILNPNGTMRSTLVLPTEPFAGPAIGPDGSLYYGEVDRFVSAVSSDGLLRWRYPTGDQVHASPVVAEDGTVYVPGTDLLAINADGTLRWSWSTPGVSLSGTRVSLGADGSVHVPELQRFVALNPEDGSIRWATPALDPGYESVSGADGTVYFVDDTGVVAVGPNGGLQWQFPAPNLFFNSTLAIGPDGALLVLSNTRGFWFQQ